MALDLRRLRASLTLTVIVGAITAVLLPVPVEAANEVPGPIDVVELLDPPARICGNEKQLDGPSSPPDGAVVIQPGTNVSNATNNHAAGTVFWLAPGTHTTGPGQYDNITPKQGNTYIGAPGAVLDGKGVNAYAFTGKKNGVRIAYLTIRNFVAPNQQGVVNHDQANGWLIEHNTIEDNSGAALMGGARQVLRYNCIARNGQYGLNYFQTGDAIKAVVVDHNEIVRNNTDHVDPDCGCSGGAKFWAVNGAEITNNWVHDNFGVGLWADTNNRDFLFEGNLIQDNDDVGLFYEISYNAVIRNNTFRENAHEVGRGDGFPTGAIYISESGGDGRVAGPASIEIVGNWFKDDYNGITLWENADRFCNSPNNSSSDYCTLVAGLGQCDEGSISSQPNYDNCRWKTQNVDIHGNVFQIDRTAIDGCDENCGKNALFSNYGTNPDWSPYMGDVISQAITFDQGNVFHNNTYIGSWRFVAFDIGNAMGWDDWRSSPYRQDAGSDRVDFIDVLPEHTFFEDVEWLKDEGITLGCNPPDNTRFCPEEDVSRGQMASFLARAMDLPAGGDVFADDDGSTHEDNINRLAASGITLGCTTSGHSFCPDEPVTRAQMASFLARAFDLPAASADAFDDDDDGWSTHEDNINRLAATGITRGCTPDGAGYCPAEPVTRGQMAGFLHRSEEYLPG